MSGLLNPPAAALDALAHVRHGTRNIRLLHLSRAMRAFIFKVQHVTPMGGEEARSQVRGAHSTSEMRRLPAAFAKALGRLACRSPLISVRLQSCMMSHESNSVGCCTVGTYSVTVFCLPPFVVLRNAEHTSV